MTGDKFCKISLTDDELRVIAESLAHLIKMIPADYYDDLEEGDPTPRHYYAKFQQAWLNSERDICFSRHETAGLLGYLIGRLGGGNKRYAYISDDDTDSLALASVFMKLRKSFEAAYKGSAGPWGRVRRQFRRRRRGIE